MASLTEQRLQEQQARVAVENPDIVGERLIPDSDPSDQDTDSAIGDEGNQSSSSSLASTVTSFRTMYGRRYHAFDDNAYWLPNDDMEISRLDLQHLVWKLSLNGRLHIAPVPDDVHRVVDLGTGTGKWAIEFSDAHPSATVFGTDLSPIQSTMIPPNCTFFVENVEDDWTFTEPFDYIHSRMLCLGIHSWERYFQQCWDHLKPGGWCEVQETKFPAETANPNCPEDSPLLKWSSLLGEAAANDGIDANPTGRFRGILESIGFVNIREQPVQWPIGTWAKGDREKLIGRIMVDNLLQFYRASAMMLYTKRLGWTAEQVEEFLPSVHDDILDRSKCIYVQMRIVAAQKPETTT